MNKLNQELITHWQQLRSMTYDFLDSITVSDVARKLPFKKSQTLGNQFFCMTGTQETFIEYIKTGVWTNWICSLIDRNTPKLADIKSSMKAADTALTKLLNSTDLLKPIGNGTPLSRYLILVEHESHHQGQLINFIYAHHLPIPQSWADKWDLK